MANSRLTYEVQLTKKEVSLLEIIAKEGTSKSSVAGGTCQSLGSVQGSPAPSVAHDHRELHASSCRQQQQEASQYHHPSTPAVSSSTGGQTQQTAVVVSRAASNASSAVAPPVKVVPQPGLPHTAAVPSPSSTTITTQAPANGSITPAAQATVTKITSDAPTVSSSCSSAIENLPTVDREDLSSVIAYVTFFEPFCNVYNGVSIGEAPARDDVAKLVSRGTEKMIAPRLCHYRTECSTASHT